MLRGWDSRLRTWEEAGLIEAGLAARIREFEAQRTGRGDWRWPVILAWIFGGMLLCAGVLLFVAAHWDDLSSSGRFSLVVLMIAVFHVAGALLRRKDAVLGHVLHGVGTVALGAGIYLAGQIFNLQEHWPGAVMLWAAGAWLAWLLLRDRIQAAFAALLTPVWLAGEWVEAGRDMSSAWEPMGEGLLLLALAYLGARTLRRDGPVRHDLASIGGLACIPLTFWVVLAGIEGFHRYADREPIPSGLLLAGFLVAYGGPLALGFLLRGRAGWAVVAAAVWVRALSAAAAERHRHDEPFSWSTILVYVLCAIGAALMAWWGIHESRRERVNLAVTAFGLTVICFYFDNVMDKLGRSVSLMSLGVLFLVGGYLLARMRRRLLARLEEGGP